MNAAYEAWDPQDKTAEDLFRPFGISKQAFFQERRRRGLSPLKRDVSSAAAFIQARPEETAAGVELLLQILDETRRQVKRLEAENSALRQQVYEMEVLQGLTPQEH